MKKVQTLVFIIFSLLISFPAYAQDISGIKTQYGRKTIKEVEIKGNHTVSVPAIISQMKLKEGALLDETVISEDVKRLYATGYFTDVKVDVEEIDAKMVKVVVLLKEKKTLKQVVIKGNRHINDKKVFEAIGLKPGDFMSERQLAEDIRRIKKLYEDKGFPYSEISTELKDFPDTNEVELTVVIKEKVRRRIKKIVFEGNEVFSKRKLKKLLKTKRDTLFTSGFLKEAVLEADMARLKAFYEREGYVDIEVTWQLEPAKKEGNLLLLITIKEGKQYKVGQIDIAGNVIFPSNALYEKLELASGDAFSVESVQKDTGAIQQFYYDRGYIFAEIKVSTKFDPATQDINVNYNIVENEVAYINKINIKGNTKTKDIVIRRELRMNPGEKFDGSKITRSKERLYNLGFFEEVSFDTVDTDVPNKEDLLVSVKEAKTGELSFGAGFSSIDKVMGFVELAQHNFDIANWDTFTGDGQDLRLRASMGTVRRDMLLSWTEPWMLDYPVLFGFDLYNRSLLRESDIGVGYDEERRGGNLRLGKEFTEHFRGDFLYKLERVVISNVVDEATTDFKNEIGKNYLSTIRPSLTYDTRDSIFNPTVGHMLTGSWELAGGIFGGDKEFSKYYATASKYFSFREKHVLELKLRAGAVHAFGDSEYVPIYERFFAGGTNTIRGYEERGVGPKDASSSDPIGGEAIMVANAEYTFPIIDVIKGAFFVDTGNVWSKIGDFGSGDYRTGAGIGVRIKTPVGPVRLDYGYPINPADDEDDTGRVHFSLSKGF